MQYGGDIGLLLLPLLLSLPIRFIECTDARLLFGQRDSLWYTMLCSFHLVLQRALENYVSSNVSIAVAGFEAVREVAHSLKQSSFYLSNWERTLVTVSYQIKLGRM